MTDIVGQRLNISTEATDFRSAISESILQRVGASQNFINNFQIETHAFHGNGNYGVVLTSIGVFPAVAYDGYYLAPFNMEVMGVYITNGISGSSGTTTVDIHKLTSGGTVDAGTIFSTKPAVASTAANGTSGGIVYNASTVSTDNLPTAGLPTGFTAPVFTSLPFNLDQGEILRADIDAVMGGTPENISVVVYLRPR